VAIQMAYFCVAWRAGVRSGRVRLDCRVFAHGQAPWGVFGFATRQCCSQELCEVGSCGLCKARVRARTPLISTHTLPASRAQNSTTRLKLGAKLTPRATHNSGCGRASADALRPAGPSAKGAPAAARLCHRVGRRAGAKVVLVQLQRARRELAARHPELAAAGERAQHMAGRRAKRTELARAAGKDVGRPLPLLPCRRLLPPMSGNGAAAAAGAAGGGSGASMGVENRDALSASPERRRAASPP